MTNMLKIQTATGIYEVKKPGGKVGAKSMMMLSEIATAEGIMKVPKVEDGEDPVVIEKVIANNSRITMIKAEEVFVKWAPEVIPTILVSLDGNPVTYDDVPGEDQLAIFLALSSEMKMSEEFFRIVP
jgi:hypothetical protein